MLQQVGGSPLRPPMLQRRWHRGTAARPCLPALPVFSYKCNFDSTMLLLLQRGGGTAARQGRRFYKEEVAVLRGQAVVATIDMRRWRCCEARLSLLQ